MAVIIGPQDQQLAGLTKGVGTGLDALATGYQEKVKREAEASKQLKQMGALYDQLFPEGHPERSPTHRTSFVQQDPEMAKVVVSERAKAKEKTRGQLEVLEKLGMISPQEAQIGQAELETGKDSFQLDERLFKTGGLEELLGMESPSQQLLTPDVGQLMQPGGGVQLSQSQAALQPQQSQEIVDENIPVFSPKVQARIDKTKSYSASTPDPDYSQIAGISVVSKGIGDVRTKEAEMIQRKKTKEADRHEKLSVPYLTEVQKVGRTLPMKRSMLTNINDAISKGGNFTRDWMADKTGMDWLRSSEGVQLNTAGKEFFLEDLSRIKGGRVNQFLERTLKQALTQFGIKPQANATIAALMEMNVKINEAESEIGQQVADALEDKHGFLHRDLEPISTAYLSDEVQRIEDETIAEIRRIQEMNNEQLSFYLQEKTGSVAPLEPVEQGTPLDKATMNRIMKQVGGDKAKGRELARSLGYAF